MGEGLKLKYTEVEHKYLNYVDLKMVIEGNPEFCCDQLMSLWGSVFNFGLLCDSVDDYGFYEYDGEACHDGYRIDYCPFCSAKLEAECVGVEHYKQVVKTVTEVIPAKETTRNVTVWIKE